MALVTTALTHRMSHEIAISRLFDGNVRFEGAEPIFDEPLLVLLFTNRSGSNLLAELLNGTGWTCGLDEFLNAEVVAEATRASQYRSFPDYVAATVRRVAADGRLFGTKACVEQLMMLRRWGTLGMFRGLRLVAIARRDVLGQAISMSIAEQTKQWKSTMSRRTDDVTYDPTFIDAFLDRIAQQDAARALAADVLGTPVHRVEYEALVEDPRPVVGSILSHLGVKEEPLHLPPPVLQRQADTLNAEFRARYVGELAVSADPAVAEERPSRLRRAIRRLRQR